MDYFRSVEPAPLSLTQRNGSDFPFAQTILPLRPVEGKRSNAPVRPVARAFARLCKRVSA
jgi:hypothetical protein